jgi:hypothetical protein
MKKTVYFKEVCAWNNPVPIIDMIIKQKDDFLETNKDEIIKIDSEDLKVYNIGNNNNVCIIRLTYYVK